MHKLAARLKIEPHPCNIALSIAIRISPTIPIRYPIKGQEYYVYADSFNENGIAPEEIIKVV